MRFHGAPEASPQLQGTLIVATEGPGSVGQLAADLLISTWQARKPTVARRVGWLHESALLPAVGTSDAAPGALAMALELYRLADGVFLLQQRAPAALGMQHAYAERLGAWVAEAGFSQVLLLGSLDAALRRDEQLGGKQLRFWAPEPGSAAGGQGASASSLAKRCAAAGLTPLEASWLAERPLERQLLPPWPAALQLQARGLAGLSAVLAFAAEGESREAAAALAAAAAAAAGLVAAGDAVHAWQPPPSWQWAFSRGTAVY